MLPLPLLALSLSLSLQSLLALLFLLVRYGGVLVVVVTLFGCCFCAWCCFYCVVVINAVPDVVGEGDVNVVIARRCSIVCILLVHMLLARLVTCYGCGRCGTVALPSILF